MLDNVVALRGGIRVSRGRSVLAKQFATRFEGGRDELSVCVESSLCEIVGNHPFRLRERFYESFIRILNIDLPREGE